MEFKNSPHNLETLQKIKNTIEELKKNIKTYKKSVKECIYMYFDNDFERYEIMEKLNNKIHKYKNMINLLRKNLKIDKNKIKCVVVDKEENKYYNLPLEIENIIIDCHLYKNETLNNLPITLKNIFQYTYCENKEDEEEQKNKLKIPFGCKYILDNNAYILKSVLKKYKIDTKNIYELVIFNNIILYKKIDFDKYFDDEALMTTGFLNDFY